MNTEKKLLTWQELKDFINNLPEKELSKPVTWWGDERGGTATEISVLQEDYINMGEGFEPLSAYSEEKDFDIEDAEEEIKEKGTPILWVD